MIARIIANYRLHRAWRDLDRRLAAFDRATHAKRSQASRKGWQRRKARIA